MASHPATAIIILGLLLAAVLTRTQDEDEPLGKCTYNPVRYENYQGRLVLCQINSFKIKL